jgi:dipeptidyl aminopeptidase/acylaminoacyl peptidase
VSPVVPPPVALRRHVPLPLLLLALVALPLPGTAQTPETETARRALQLEDYYRIRSVESPEISPDGRWVAFTVSLPVEEDNGTIRQVWVVEADGTAAPVRLLHGGEDVGRPRWEDGGRLRYTLRDTTWVRDPGDPSAPPAPVASADAPPEGLVSPDGRWVARVDTVQREPRAERPMTEFQRRHQARFRGADFDWYPFRADGRAFPLPDPASIPAREVFVEPVDGGHPPRRLTELGLQAGGVQWLPGSDALLFTANADILDELAYGTTDLFQVTTDGVLTRLTEDGYDYGSLDVSPDGRWISYIRSWGTDLIVREGLAHGGPRDLYLRPVEGGEPVNLTADWDLDPSNPRWSPEGGHLYFTAGIGGSVHLFRVAVAGGPVEQVTTGDRRIGSLSFDRDFRRMAYTVGEFHRPSDVWSADIDGGNERRLSDVNASFLEEVDLASRAPETLRWASFDGTEIEGFLLFPPEYDPDTQRYPLIVMNHGGPHAASGHGFNFKNSLFAAHGYLVFLPNFRASTGYGTDFKWATWGGWGNLDGEDVLSGVDHLIARYGVDRDRVGSTGHSYGGILTNWLITRYPDRFRAAVSGAGESNWTSNYALSDVARTKDTEFFGPPWDPRAREIMVAQSPALNCGGVRAPTLFVHGEVDYRVPLEGSIQLYTCLRRQGVPSRLIIYEGQAHGIQGNWNVVHRTMHELDWWERYLRPRERTADGG